MASLTAADREVPELLARFQPFELFRCDTIVEIPILRLASASNNSEKIKAIIKNLMGRGQSKPRKLKTLANTINSLFTNKLEDMELMSLIKILQELKYITVKQGNVAYKLPKLQ